MTEPKWIVMAGLVPPTASSLRLAKGSSARRRASRFSAGVTREVSCPLIYSICAMSDAPAACLIGWPAAHSRSPLIHHYWLRTLDIEGGYNIEAVPPEALTPLVLHFTHQ